MSRLRRGTSLWLTLRRSSRPSSSASRASQRRPGDRRRRHHGLRRCAPAGVSGRARRADRCGADRPWQHGREHGAADAGARRRLRRARRPLRRVRGARYLGNEPAGGAQPCQDVEETARRPQVESRPSIYFTRHEEQVRVEEGARGTTPGRGRRRMADAGEAESRGRLRRSWRNPHARQRAGRSIQRLYGFRTGCPAGRRPPSRAHTGALDQAARRRRRNRHRPGTHRRGAGRDRHGLRHGRIQAAGRTFPAVRHLCRRNAAARSCGARAIGLREVMLWDTGAPTTTPGGPPTIAFSSAATISRTSARRPPVTIERRISALLTERARSVPGRPRAPIATTPGKACSRRHLMACPTSARTGAIRGTSLRSATAGTG